MKKKLVMYHGERGAMFGSIQQLFKTKDGEEMYWVGRRGVFFGEVYEITHDDKMAKRPARAEGETWEPTEAEEREYEAQKIVCRAIREARARELKIKKPHDDITRAVNLLRPFYRGLSDQDRRKFMQWVANACSRKKK